MSCPNCACDECVASRVSYRWPPRPDAAGVHECAYDLMRKEYAALGQVMPTAMYLVCLCPRCSPIRM